MKQLQQIKILAIETSCDETAAAIIGCANNTEEQRNRRTEGQICPVILSNVVSSQIDLHAKTGGVVPEVASRAHMEAIIPVIKEALLLGNSKIQDTIRQLADKQIPISNFQEGCHSELAEESYNRVSGSTDGSKKNNNLTIQQFNNPDLSSITHIAVTVGPGLIGSLLVGFNTAKSLAYALDIPIIPVNHIEGHIYSALSGEIPRYKIQETNKSQIKNSEAQTSNATNTENLCQSVEEICGSELNGIFPILALTVSGGHSSLTLMHDHGKYENVGQTLDDAAGEAFDKVAKLLDLGYPGGPALSRIAEEYREKKTKSDMDVIASHRPAGEARQSIMGSDCFVPRNDKGSSISLPLPLKNDKSFNFSFSGLKTAVLNSYRKAEKEHQDSPEKLVEFKHELACVFEETAVAHLIDKTMKAVAKYQPKSILLAGGVSANKYLRQRLSEEVNNLAIASGGKQSNNLNLLVPPINLCGDNAAMIGLAAYYHVIQGNTSNWNEIKIDSNLKL